MTTVQPRSAHETFLGYECLPFIFSNELRITRKDSETEKRTIGK